MPRNHFTQKKVEYLSTNPYVKSVSTKEITYTDEFKNWPHHVFVSKDFKVVGAN